MPSADHATTYSRQWELLKFLPSKRPGITARDLCDRLVNAGHEVNLRTVQRDLIELSRIFPISSNEISKPYGWHWNPGARVDLPGISLAEAVSLGMLENVLKQLIPQNFLTAMEPRFAAAVDKLKALPKNHYAKWTDLVRYLPGSLPILKPNIDPEVFEVVQESLLKKMQIKVSYQSAGADAAKSLILHPLAFIQQAERSYLVATTYEFPEVLYYALNRMRSAVMLDQPSKRPKGFSLDEFLGEKHGPLGEGESIQLKAEIDKGLAIILQETPLSKDQKMSERAGKFLITATVSNSWQLHRWILSQGPSIIIEKPLALRKSIQSKIKQSLAHYSP